MRKDDIKKKGGIETGGSAAKTVTEAECRHNSSQKAPIKAKGGIKAAFSRLYQSMFATVSCCSRKGNQMKRSLCKKKYIAAVRITTAILSFGMSGKLFHSPFIEAHEGFELYAVWERSRKLAQEIYPRIRSYNTYEEVLQDDKIALVIVNTPNYTHYDFTKKALLAGKHVIVEKPFTVHSKEGEELGELAEKSGLKLSVYHNRRFDSDHKTVANILNAGSLGEIVEAEIHFDRYREALSPKQHKETAGEGTGALYDLGSHLIDQALQLFGKPLALFADIASFRPQSEVDDFFELLFYYPDKRVRLRCSYIVREAVPSIVIHGRKGSFLKPRGDVQEAQLQAGVKPGKIDWGNEDEGTSGVLHNEEGRKLIDSERGNYMEYFDGIYQSIQNNAPLPVTASESIDVIRIIETAFESHRTGKMITL